MNDALREAAKVDPEWAKKEARRQFVLKATVAGTLLALAIGAVSFVLSYHDAERITRVEQSACQVDATGRECQKIKAEASRVASIATTCIPFFKAGYPCPKPGSTAAQRQSKRQLQANSKSAQNLDNSSSEGATDSPSSPNAPSVGDQTGGHGGSPASHHPTSHPSPAPSPSSGGPGAAPGQTGSGSSAPASTETSSTPAAGDSTSTPSESVVESTQTHVGEVVTETGELLHTTVCGLTAPLLCPKR